MALVVLAAAALFVAFSPHFERIEPRIGLPEPLHWNMHDPLAITLSDNSGLRDYRITLMVENRELLLAEGRVKDGNRSIELAATYPDRILPRASKAQLHLQVRDTSLWRLFQGNETEQVLDITLDPTPPVVNVIGHSYAIATGGSAATVFEAHDEHLKDLYIETRGGKRFDVTSFYEEGFYASLLARDVRDQDFVAYIIALDHAGNRTRVRIPLVHRNISYRRSDITLNERFLRGKIDELHYRYDATGRDDENLEPTDKFLFVNEVLRGANTELLAEVTTAVPKEQIDRFEMKPFRPLPGSAVVAHFGDRRDFYYEGERISRSYHLGLDLASIAKAEVFASNPGEVVFVGDVGIYGNTPIIHHGLGLYSFYSHSTDTRVKEGDRIQAGDVVATTGTSGLALGDHLHFELHIQGIPVAPREWMDGNWIATNITRVFEEARTTIDGRNQ
jgi:murein DD-endopeptidase MepM/ murein hydrolase activator NlpD